MDLSKTMSTIGPVAPRRQLLALGHSPRQVAAALSAGVLLPVRPGWVASPDAGRLAVYAVLNGARLTAATALREIGVWSGHDRRVHLQLPANAHHRIRQPLTPLDAFAPPPFVPQRTVIHWAPCLPAGTDQPAWRVGIVDALVRFAKNETDEQVVAALESAVHEGKLAPRSLPLVFDRLPRRLNRLAPRLTLLAESGLESIGRLRLERLGHHVQQQVQIGPDRVDLVIDGWLIVEFDGDSWHDPARDRVRTNRLVRAGYLVLRFGHDDLFHRWEETLATIRAALGRRMPA